MRSRTPKYTVSTMYTVTATVTHSSPLVTSHTKRLYPTEGKQAGDTVTRSAGKPHCFVTTLQTTNKVACAVDARRGTAAAAAAAGGNKLWKYSSTNVRLRPSVCGQNQLWNHSLINVITKQARGGGARAERRVRGRGHVTSSHSLVSGS